MSSPPPSSLSFPTHTPLTSRTLGALLGVHTGDALGATLEFVPWSKIIRHYPLGLRDIIGGGHFKWAPGAATDDTDLTRAVLLAYAEGAEAEAAAAGEETQTATQTETQTQTQTQTETSPPFDIPTAFASHALDWLEGAWPGRRKRSRPVDMGAATHTGLRNYKRTRDMATSGAGAGSAGNGSLMRCVPTALFARADARVRESMRISAVTHDDRRCTVACAAYCEIVAGLVAGETARGAVGKGRDVARGLPGGEAVVEAIEAGERLVLAKVAGEGPRVAGVDAAGYVLGSLTLAVAAVLDERGFEDVLVDVVRIGDDADTNGAIAGGLLGARDGVEGIPERWLGKLQFRGEFEEVALRILRVQGRV